MIQELQRKEEDSEGNVGEDLAGKTWHSWRRWLPPQPLRRDTADVFDAVGKDVVEGRR